MCQQKEQKDISTTGDGYDGYQDDLILQWDYMKAIGCEPMGNRGMPFVVEIDNECHVVTSQARPLQSICVLDEHTSDILEVLQHIKADFLVAADGVVTCKVGTFEAVGPDYIRAGVAALKKKAQWNAAQSAKTCPNGSTAK